jgi:hypothetical protein
MDLNKNLNTLEQMKKTPYLSIDLESEVRQEKNLRLQKLAEEAERL